MNGPVQVLVVGFDEVSFSGGVLEELIRLGDAGIVRLVDVLIVRHNEDGTLETVDVPERLGTAVGHVVAGLLAGEEPEDLDGPGWSLADAIPSGSVAAVALIEHLWAGPLVGAIRAAGGSLLEETWLAPDDVARLDDLLARPPS